MTVILPSENFHSLTTKYDFYSKETPDKNILAKELHALLKGEQNYQKLVLAHDTARVVQCLLKFSPAEIKREISEVHSYNLNTIFPFNKTIKIPESDSNRCSNVNVKIFTFLCFPDG